MRRLGAAGTLLAAALLAGCSSAPAEPAAPDGLSGPVVVFAAASLTGAFTTLARDFEQDHPGTTVTLNFGSSAALAQQVLAGAPADVLAAASPAAMALLTDAGQAAPPQVFARNSLQIAIPPDNPGKVSGLADLARRELTVALCAPTVPCGTAAERAFAAAGLTPAPDTLEQDVKAALTKVDLGEVDAALIYRTDVLAAEGRVLGLDFPEAADAVNDYPIAALSDAPHPEAAALFVAHVLSEDGRRVLADAGFQQP